MLWGKFWGNLFEARFGLWTNPSPLYQLTASLVLAPGPGPHRAGRLDERVCAAQQEAVEGGAGAPALALGVQRGRRAAVHRDHRHEPTVPHTGECMIAGQHSSLTTEQ